MSSKEYKKLYLVSPNTFEKLSKAKQTSPAVAGSSISKNFHDEYQKWINQRNKLAMQSIRKRRFHSSTSDVARKLQDKHQLQRAVDKDSAVIFGEKIPDAPKMVIPQQQQQQPRALRKKNSQTPKEKPTLQKPINLYVRDKIASQQALPLKEIDPMLYFTPQQIKAAQDELLYGNEYLTDDEDENDIQDDDEFEASFHEPAITSEPVLDTEKDLQHLVSPLFMPEHYSTPLLTSTDTLKARKLTPSSALRRLKLNSSASTPVFSTKKSRSRILPSPEPMDVLSARKDDLGSDKWMNRLLGRRHLRADNWESFD